MQYNQITQKIKNCIIYVYV